MRCTECGTQDFEQIPLPEYETDAPGIRVVLKDTVRRYVCKQCGAAKIRLPRVTTGLSQALAMIRVLVPVKLTAEELRFLRKVVGMTQKEFGEKIIPGADPSTISRWENDTQGVGGYTELVIRQNIAALLADTVKAVPYDPKFAIGMQIHDAPPPRIAVRPVKVRSAGEISEGWAEAA